MKDPLDRRPRAYEVLGLSLDANRAQVDSAYARLAATNRSGRQELADAWHRLRKPESRLEEDLWYYILGDEVDQFDAQDVGEMSFMWDPEAPATIVGDQLVELDRGDSCRRDFREVALRPTSICDRGCYEADGLRLVAIPLDK